jgi:hypothetical protein
MRRRNIFVVKFVFAARVMHSGNIRPAYWERSMSQEIKRALSGLPRRPEKFAVPGRHKKELLQRHRSRITRLGRARSGPRRR